MRLGALIDGLDEAAADQTVTGFAIDHRKVAPGNIFGAFRGAKFNGEDFIADAVSSGAIAIVAGAGVNVDGAAHIKDGEPRRAFAQLAARFFQPVPAHIAAVTGTKRQNINC